MANVRFAGRQSAMQPPKPSRPEDIVDPEWIEWYSMAPMERWEASQRLWIEYVALGGSLDPEVDTQSPFWSEEELAFFARNTAAARQDRAAAEARSAPDP